jgi:2-(1,2-epoxy-1,2-dihydrophenyl)acetyl-CoA isomerase
METLIIERRDGVATVTMNRPERKNAINNVMRDELVEVFESVERSPEDRVMVLTGAEGSFCSGADLSDPNAKGSNHWLVHMRRLGDLALSLHRIAKPTIAKVDGVAVGAGLGLALGCDLVVASDRARLSMIFAKRGLSLDNGASWLLPRLSGMAKAMEVAYFADMLSAQQAHELGMVNRVLPVGELDGFVDDWAQRLAKGPPLALSMIKTQLHQAMSLTLEEALENEARSQAVNFATADTAEAMLAFMEKREPKFMGR